MAKTTGPKAASLFELGGIPPLGKALPLGLQHVVAAVVGIITPAILVANVCGLAETEKTLLIQMSLIMTALATLIQLFPIGKWFGSGLPVIMGISFAYVPTLQAIGGQFGLPTIFGAQIIGGAVAILFGIFSKQIRRLFPPLVTGTVIFTIGLSLYPTAVRYMAGGAGSDTFGSPKNWLVAIITFATVVFLTQFTKGTLRLGSILFGMIVGYVLSLFLGMVSFDSVASAGWFAVAAPFHFGIAFNASASASLAIMYVVNCVQTIGDFTSTTKGGLDRLPTDEEIRGGIIAQGASSLVGAVFGGLPTASYSQNVGIVTVNRVVNKFVFTIAAVILAVAGFVPKFAALLTTIPQCVIGGATISVFATITMTGMGMITEGGFDTRSKTVVGLSVAMGVGVTQVSGCLAGFPSWVPTVLGSSSVVMSTLMAILLNLILPRHPSDVTGKK